MTPLQLVCQVFNSAWDAELDVIPAQETSVCLGFHYPCVEDGRSPCPFEVALEWNVASKEILFASALEEPLLPNLDTDTMVAFFEMLGSLTVPFIAPHIPDEGISAAIVPVIYRADCGQRLVAGYRSRVSCIGSEEELTQRFFAHLDCSSRLLYWSKPIFDELAKARQWPTKQQCLEHLHRSVELDKFHVPAVEVQDTVEEPEEAPLFAPRPN